MLATFAPAARTRSAGASSISSPRRPPLQNTVAKRIADASTTTASRLRWPTGEMPPATYPVARSAAATRAIAAFLPPEAAEPEEFVTAVIAAARHHPAIGAAVHDTGTTWAGRKRAHGTGR